MFHRLIQFIRSIIEAFKTSKAGGTAARRRREPPPRCPQCREFLDHGEVHDHDDEEDDTPERVASSKNED